MEPDEYDEDHEAMLEDQAIEGGARTISVPLVLNEADLIERAAERIAREYTRDRTDLARAARNRATEIIDERLNAMLPDFVTMEFPTTNQYGELKGPPATLREMIVGRLEAVFMEKVNEKGGSPSYDQRTMPRLAWMVDTAIREMAKPMVDAMVKESADKVKRDIDAGLTAQVTAAMKGLLGVK